MLDCDRDLSGLPGIEARPAEPERFEGGVAVKIVLDPSSVEDYRTFLKVKALPQCRTVGRECQFPDEYASLVYGRESAARSARKYKPPEWMFDYQKAITALSIRKKKFAVFAECGLGKCPMMLERSRYIASVLPKGRCVLMVAPLMVVRQTLQEAERFYGKKLRIEQLRASDLQGWLRKGSRIGITNYEAITDDLDRGRLGALELDEASMLKSHYGKWGTKLIEMGRGLEWKACYTGTPAPNDRIEFANHAVFLDAFPTVNSFLAKFFLNRGQTDSRWELKPHALRPFYRALSHWCIFLTNPATYGWKDNTENVPPVRIHIHDVELTQEQQDLVYRTNGTLFADQIGGITSRSVLSQIAKGNYKGKDVETRKPAFIRSLVDSWPEESTIIWCIYNREQEILEREFPGAASLKGDTPQRERERMIDEFKAGTQNVIISKAKVMGYGLNLQRCTRQVFSGLQDSYESYHQCIKRANRYGSSLPLNVHIPVVEPERPMIETVLRKASCVQADTEEQERTFKEAGYAFA